MKNLFKPSLVVPIACTLLVQSCEKSPSAENPVAVTQEGNHNLADSSRKADYYAELAKVNNKYSSEIKAVFSSESLGLSEILSDVNSEINSLRERESEMEEELKRIPLFKKGGPAYKLLLLRVKKEDENLTEEERSEIEREIKIIVNKTRYASSFAYKIIADIYERKKYKRITGEYFDSYVRLQDTLESLEAKRIDHVKDYISGIYESLQQQRGIIDSKFPTVLSNEDKVKVESFVVFDKFVVLELRNLTDKPIRSLKMTSNLTDELGDVLSKVDIKYMQKDEGLAIPPKSALFYVKGGLTGGKSSGFVTMDTLVQEHPRILNLWGSNLGYPGGGDYHDVISSEIEAVKYSDTESQESSQESVKKAVAQKILLHNSDAEAEGYSQGDLNIKYLSDWPYVQHAGGEWMRGELESEGVYQFSEDKFYILTLDFNNKTYTENAFDGSFLDELTGTWSVSK